MHHHKRFDCATKRSKTPFERLSALFVTALTEIHTAELSVNFEYSILKFVSPVSKQCSFHNLIRKSKAVVWKRKLGLAVDQKSRQRTSQSLFQTWAARRRTWESLAEWTNPSGLASESCGWHAILCSSDLSLLAITTDVATCPT